MLQQGCRRFLADTRHSGNVIDLIAHKRQQIDNELRGHTEFLDHARSIHCRVIHGVNQRYVLIHQLRHVFVAGGNDDLATGARSF